MSVRRGLTVLVIAGVAAAVAAPAASAKTKTVIAGGPPPKASQAGKLKFPAALDLNGFFRKTITIRAGDSVKWVFSTRVVHTVTFLAKGDSRPPLERPDAANPYTGFNDSQGMPFWFNGQPSIEIPPEHAFPQGGSSADGRTYRNSGLSAPAFTPYTLKFPKKARVPSARADRKARIAEFAKALKAADRLGKLKPKGNDVVAGNDNATVAWFRFFPATRTIKAGESVRFSITSRSEIHTMSFGPQATSDFVMVQPQPSGPPRLQFSPLVIMPSDNPLPPYTGTNHGNGFFNTGVIDVNPASPNPSSVSVAFTNPGSYLFECTIHPGMQGTIKVE